MSKNSAILVPSSPGLSTVQILASTTFAPIGFVFPTDGHDKQAVQKNLQYAWKEIRRWHRSFSILCDEAEDADILVSEPDRLTLRPTTRLAEGMTSASEPVLF